ncbi:MULTISPECIES: BrnT family toxin [Marinobacter]|nr:BrnT family toxin [Marinobacter shengliensis]MCD1629151.1 BrnT family toxin [Marinobacter shengliensis]PKM04591.1 MAG: BrnT family toxin [Gammaproteobacteria bacterium HGW-Gammaproteobacteria-6]
MDVFEFDGTKSQANLDKHWSAVVTYREGRIRLISVRRSRKKEVELYES